MTDAEFAGSTIERAWEPPEEVVVPFPLAYHPILQPEDYGVLIRLLLRDPGKPSSTAALAAEFQASGWKMGDSRLRGVMARLKKAGNVRRGRDGYDPATGRPKWAFAVYRNPANNPDHVSHDTHTAPQVSPIRWIPTDRAQTPRSDALESNVYAGQSDPLKSNGSDSDALDSDALESNVYAGQSDPLKSNGSTVSPPTPPLLREEEEDSSSSLDPSTAAGAVAELDQAAVTAAREFLTLLPGRWACGRKTAARLAPLLVEAVAAQGWVLGPALVAQLTRRARGKSAEAAVVLAERIEDLPLYQATRATVPGEQRDQARTPAAAQLPFDGPAAGLAAPGDATTSGPEQPAPVVVPAEQVAQARKLLLSLTAPWHIGPGDAERLAPLLAVVVAERGWSFDEELRQQLMSNPGGGSNYPWLLEHKRIKALPVRRKAPRVRRETPGMCARHPWYREGDCSACMKAAQDAARAVAAGQSAAAPDQDPAPAAPDQDGTADIRSGLPDVDAYLQALMSGMSPAAGLGLDDPKITAEERRRIAAQSEEERRHEAHNHALRTAP
jgi:hypothetical protein